MRKSRSETAETRARIVSTATQLFLERGLECVGMRDVMKAADLTAGGFYRHFSSKDKLIAEAVGAAFDRLLDMFEQETAGKPPRQALQRIVTLYLAQSQTQVGGVAPYLCPLALLGSELRHASPAVRAVAFDGHQRLTSLIARCVAHLPQREATGVADTIISLLLGAVTSANLAPNARTASRTLAQARAAILERLSKPELRA